MTVKLSKYINTKTSENKIEKIDIFLVLLLITIVLISTIPSLLEFEFNRSSILRIENSQRSLADTIFGVDAAHPPMMFLTYKVYFNFVQSLNPALISLPTFIFWILSIATFFLVLSKMFGLIPAIISTHAFILFSGNNHSYMFGIENMYMFIFFATLSFYFLYKSFVLKDEKSKWLLLISNIFMIWSYYASWFILIGQFLFLIIHKKKEFFSIKNLKYYILLAIFSLPILLFFVSEILFGDAILKKSPQTTRYEFFESIIINSHPLIHNLAIKEIFIPFILFLIVFLISIIYLFVKSDKYKIAVYYLLPFLLIIPFIIDNRYFLRYNTAFMWIVFILISYPLCAIIHLIKNKSNVKKIYILFVLAVVMITIINYSQFNLNTENRPYKIAIEDYMKEDFNILIFDELQNSIYIYHFAKRWEDINNVNYYCNIENIKMNLFIKLIHKINSIMPKCKNNPFDELIYNNNNWLLPLHFKEDIIEITTTPIIYETLKNIKDFNESHYEFVLHIHDEKIKKVINNLLNCEHLNDYQVNDYHRIVSSYKCVVNQHGDY